MLRTSDLDFDLPPELIARTPAVPRDSSRLLVVSRSDPSLMEHTNFRALPAWLRRGDVLVFNRSRVLPARFEGRRLDTGGSIGGLYLESACTGHWRVMLRAGGRLTPGLKVGLTAPSGDPSPTVLELVEPQGPQWLVRVWRDGAPDERPPADVLQEVGSTPLPPYILSARKAAGDDIQESADRDWYQTVYAEQGGGGSVAAPTAGLHFTAELLETLVGGGVERADVMLHVGQGTFRQVDAEFVEQHPMHSEWCEVPALALARLRGLEAARRGVPSGNRGPRLFAVGTTSARTLESLPHSFPGDALASGIVQETRLLITPGFPWRWCDGLITNFHLPRSSLLAMVAAMFPQGIERVHEVYARAITERYRFFSYGDAMLILP